MLRLSFVMKMPKSFPNKELRDVEPYSLEDFENNEKQ